MVIEKGDKVAATITKVKNGVATKVEVDGREYSLVHKTHMNGRGKK